jgi:hypothetical protein
MTLECLQLQELLYWVLMFLGLDCLLVLRWELALAIIEYVSCVSQDLILAKSCRRQLTFIVGDNVGFFDGEFVGYKVEH